jgi:uncharacterized lipoprotein YbaY
MKYPKILGAVLAAGLLVSGCSNLDVTAPSPEDRVLTGTVNYDLAVALPADAVVTVRIIDASNPAVPLNVLGETTIANPGGPPIPFRIEFRASDQTLAHQVRVDARIAIGGKLRFHSVAGHPVTPGNVNDPHAVLVEPTAGKW